MIQERRRGQYRSNIFAGVWRITGSVVDCCATGTAYNPTESGGDRAGMADVPIGEIGRDSRALE